MNTAAYKTRLLESITAVLAPAGFRRRGSLYRREVNDVLHLVATQSSMSSTAAVLRLTLNLGIWAPSLEEPDVGPSVHSAHWRQRIGSFTSQKQDGWWEIRSGDDVDRAAREIASALTDAALPALQELSSLEALSALWSSGRGPGLTDQQRAHYLARAQLLGATTA